MKTSNHKLVAETANKTVETYHNLNGFADYENFDDELLNADATPAVSAATSQPYILSIANAYTANISSVVVLGARQNLPANVTNYGNSNGITITMGIANVTYGQFLYQTLTNPFTVGLTYIQSSNSSQVLQAITVQHQDANGNLTQKALTPVIDPYQQQSGTIALKNIYSVDGDTTLIIASMLASATLTMYLYPSNNLSTRRVLGGVNPEQAFSNPGIINNQQLSLSKSAVSALKSAGV